MRFAREGDEIICTRIDRCARSMADFQRIVTEWRKQGISFRAVDQAGVVLDGSPHSDLFLNLLMAFTEFETRLRRERQMDGIKTKKEADKGKPRSQRTYRGRPPTIDASKVRDLKEREGIGASEIAKRLGIGRAYVYRILSESAHGAINDGNQQ